LRLEHILYTGPASYQDTNNINSMQICCMFNQLIIQATASLFSIMENFLMIDNFLT